MTGSGMPGSSQSLRRQARNLEKQLILRRQRVRMTAHCINRKISAEMTSPGMLLAAVGIGVAVEQTGHHRGWSLSGILNATNACINLLLSFSSVTPQARKDCTNKAE